jgi:hypothetical protein
MEPCRGSDPGPNPGPGAIFFFIIFSQKSKVHFYRLFLKESFCSDFSSLKGIADQIISFLFFTNEQVLNPMYFL